MIGLRYAGAPRVQGLWQEAPPPEFLSSFICLSQFSGSSLSFFVTVILNSPSGCNILRFLSWFLKNYRFLLVAQCNCGSSSYLVNQRR